MFAFVDVLSISLGNHGRAFTNPPVIPLTPRHDVHRDVRQVGIMIMTFVVTLKEQVSDAT